MRTKPCNWGKGIGIFLLWSYKDVRSSMVVCKTSCYRYINERNMGKKEGLRFLLDGQDYDLIGIIKTR